MDDEGNLETIQLNENKSENSNKEKKSISFIKEINEQNENQDQNNSDKLNNNSNPELNIVEEEEKLKEKEEEKGEIKKKEEEKENEEEKSEEEKGNEKEEVKSEIKKEEEEKENEDEKGEIKKEEEEEKNEEEKRNEKEELKSEEKKEEEEKENEEEKGEIKKEVEEKENEEEKGNEKEEVKSEEKKQEEKEKEKEEEEEDINNIEIKSVNDNDFGNNNENDNDNDQFTNKNEESNSNNENGMIKRLINNKEISVNNIKINIHTKNNDNKSEEEEQIESQDMEITNLDEKIINHDNSEANIDLDAKTIKNENKSKFEAKYDIKINNKNKKENKLLLQNKASKSFTHLKSDEIKFNFIDNISVIKNNNEDNDDGDMNNRILGKIISKTITLSYCEIELSENQELESKSEESADKQKYSKKFNDYSFSYFEDKNNYFLPKIQTINEYRIILINFENKEYLINDEENNLIYDENSEQQLNLFVQKKYIEEKCFDIKNYFNKRKTIFEKFIEAFGAIPFFGFKNTTKDITLDSNDIIENNNDKDLHKKKYKFKNDSTIGRINHFVNLLYRYNKYKNNKNDKEENKNGSIINYLEDLLKEIDINSMVTDIMNKNDKKQNNKNNSNSIENDNLDKNEINKSKFIKKKSKINITNKKDIYFFRIVHNDGNSFYRAFIFSLIEMYIIENNITDLRNLIILMTNSFHERIYKDKDVNYEEPIKILEKILNLLIHTKTRKALILFYDSFSINEDYFDKFLINFLKITLCFSKKKILSIIDLDEIEFELYDLILLPFIFDINLEISFDINIGKNDFINFSNYKKRVNKTCIELCFYKNNTFIYYSIDKYLKLVELEIIKEYENIPKIKNIIYENKVKLRCKNCEEDTIHIALIEKKVQICKTCLDKYIDELRTNRVKLLSENFHCMDVFFKDFEIKKNSIYLEDYLYLHLYDNHIIDSIQEIFLNKINEKEKWVCSKCRKFISKTKKLNCGCYYCSECRLNIIKKMTNGYIILNQYEKKNLKRIRCICGNNMDLLNLIEDYENDESTNKNNYSMNERLNSYINLICMNCECKVYKYENNNADKINIRKISAINISNNINVDHVLCKKCFEVLKLNKLNYIEIFCKICNENHNIKEK